MCEKVVLRPIETVRYQNEDIIADTCVLLPGVGVLFYQKDQLIARVKGNYEIKEMTEKGKVCWHLRPSDHSSSIYINYEQVPNRKLEAGERVALVENDVAFGLSVAYQENPSLFDQFSDQIEQEYLWMVEEIIEEFAVKISKDDQTRYVGIRDVCSVSMIKGER